MVTMMRMISATAAVDDGDVAADGVFSWKRKTVS